MAGAVGEGGEGFDQLMASLVSDVLSTPGDADASTRRAAFDAAAAVAQGEHASPAVDALPVDLRAFVDTVARHAYRVTDRMVDDLLATGHSEDELFEVILAAATGAGAARLEMGTRVVREAARAAG
jgi:hypothetical protein